MTAGWRSGKLGWKCRAEDGLLAALGAARDASASDAAAGERALGALVADVGKQVKALSHRQYQSQMRTGVKAKAGVPDSGGRALVGGAKAGSAVATQGTMCNGNGNANPLCLDAKTMGILGAGAERFKPQALSL